MLPEGWLTDAEADELRRLATGRTVLELGAWKGRSTVVLAEVAERVVSVDRHEGIPPAHLGDSLPEYLANVRDLENVVVVVGYFEAVVPLLRPLDLVYVDGDHDGPAAERDARLALSVARQAVVFHDWDFPELAEAVARVLGREPDALVGSLASYDLSA